MGYQAQITIEDAHHRRWTGLHRADVPDLSHLFECVVRMDLTLIRASASSASDHWRSLLPPEVQIVRMLSPGLVRIRIPSPRTLTFDGAAPISDVVLKVALPARAGLRGRLLSLFGAHSRAHRAFHVAHRLRAFGIGTPRPLGFIERQRSPYAAPSFIAFEFVEAPTLLEARDRLLNPGATFANKRALITKTATFLRTLHRSGVLHADLHAQNLLIASDDVLVVDLESVRRFGSRHRVIVKTLERLDREFSAVGVLTRADRMRFLKTYLQYEGWNAVGRRSLWHDVEARARGAAPATQTT